MEQTATGAGPAKPKVAPKPAPAAKPSKIIIASKLPMAIELQLCEMKKVQRKFRETMWEETEAMRVGPIVRVNGTAYPTQAPEGFRNRPEMRAGYALTFNVDREWWEKWFAQNKTTEMVVNGLIFAANSAADITNRGRKEFADVDSGLGPVVVKGDSIEDRRAPKAIKGLEIKGEAGPTDAELADATG